jgi:hypothetical protein
MLIVSVIALGATIVSFAGYSVVAYNRRIDARVGSATPAQLAAQYNDARRQVVKDTSGVTRRWDAGTIAAFAPDAAVAALPVRVLQNIDDVGGAVDGDAGSYVVRPLSGSGIAVVPFDGGVPFEGDFSGGTIHVNVVTERPPLHFKCKAESSLWLALRRQFVAPLAADDAVLEWRERGGCRVGAAP